MSEGVYEIRKKNLKKIILDNYQGNYEHVAQLIERKESTLRKNLEKSTTRKISPKRARDIEIALSLPTGYLDTVNHGDQKVYYVMIQVNDSETFGVVDWLYKNAPEVVDCSTLLGEFDIFAKIEVPNFHYLELLFARIAQFPKVMRTRTFASVDSLRWQRNQSEHYSVKDPKPVKNFVDHYKAARLGSLMKEIHDIENGKISASDQTSDCISLLEIMRWTKESFFSVREFQEDIVEYEEYLEEEGRNIANGMLSQRIFTVPTNILSGKDEQETMELIFDEAKDIIDIGGEVRFISNEKWIHRGGHILPECFAVVDELFVYIKKKEPNRSVLQESDEYIQMYLNIFKRNWERAKPYEKALADFMGKGI